jgi:hypothetical protein
MYIYIFLNINNKKQEIYISSKSRIYILFKILGVIKMSLNPNNPNLKEDGNSHILLLSKTLPPLLKGGIIAFCGAGISIPPPSCSPSWWILTEEILKAFFDNIPDEYRLPKDMIIKDPDRQPEEVFETFSNILDERLFKAFKALDVAEPNPIHYALARLAKAGILKACFTTNFDIYLEHALREEKVDFELLVDNIEYENYFKKGLNKKKFVLCKIHGTIERPNTIVSIASAYKSAKGFSAPKAAIFQSLLEKYPCVFLGYSGWDFNHLNYRRFWERAGPRVKKILWNRRLNEEKGPDFRSIFNSCWSAFEFTEADLPEGLIQALEQFKDKRIYVVDLAMKVFKDAISLYARAEVERMMFFKKWVQEFPEAHTLGLAITESQKFSTAFRKIVKEFREISQDTDAVTYDFGKKMGELTQKYNSGELNLQDYQTKIFELSIENMMRSIRNEYKPRIREMIRNNKFPGITDNNNNILTFLNVLLSLTRAYDLEEAASIAADYTSKATNLMTQNSDEARAELMVINYAIRLQRPDDEQWKLYVERMYQEKGNYLSKKIDYQKFQDNLLKINQEATHEQMGMTIDLNYLLDLQVKATVSSKTEEAFEDQAGALSITIMQMAPYLYDRYNDKKVYKDLLSALAQTQLPEKQRDPNLKITKEMLDEIDALIRQSFLPVLKRAESSNPNVSSLMEMSFLAIWIIGTQYLDPVGMQEYQRMWDSGEYPKRFTPKEIYTYLRQKIEAWVESALYNLPTRFSQRLCGNLAIMGEMGDDFELCKRATLRSLELSEGMITEATPENIPGNLAAFYERSGDKKNALKYYQMCLDAVKLRVPPTWTDAIVYRTAVLLYEKGEKKKALEIIGLYHPSFRGNAGVVVLPGRKMAQELAEKIARELGYKDAHTAIESILG